MTFLRSSQIRLLQTAFQEVQVEETVKHGEELLGRLKNQENYQMGLATFLTRSQNCNARILAALQLKKMLIIKQEQTVWMLKNVYYSDIDKIANIIKHMISCTRNIELAGQFLRCNFDEMGTVEAIRYIQLTFSLLKSQQRAKATIENRFQLLYQGLLSVIQVVIQSEDLLFMFMVVLSMFYSHILQIGKQQSIDKLKKHWYILQQKCKFYSTMNLSIIKNIINKMIYGRQQNTPSNFILNLFLQVFKCISLAASITTRYYAILFDLAVKHLNIFQNKSTIIDLINTFAMYAENKNTIILFDTKINRPIQLNNTMEKDIQSEEQRIIRSNLCGLIEQIFTKHYKEISHQYNKNRCHGRPLFIQMVPLVNFYNSTENRIIQSWAKDNIENVVNEIGNSVNCIHPNQTGQQKQNLMKVSVSLIQFLVKYKDLIPISLLPHTVLLLQSLSVRISSFSQLCYNFMSHVWQCLASLNFDELSEFLLKHIRELNQNEWDHRLQNYSGFMHLAQYLQQHYQFYSKFLIEDNLIRQSIKAHQIMISLLIQSEQTQPNFQIIGQVILLTSYFIQGFSQEHYKEFHAGLNISYLSSIIEKYKLYTIQSADIVAFDRMFSKRYNNHVSKENNVQQMDEGDYLYNIELQLMQIFYCKQQKDNQIYLSLIERFLSKVNRLLSDLEPQKLQEFRNSRIWGRYIALTENKV